MQAQECESDLFLSRRLLNFDISSDYRPLNQEQAYFYLEEVFDLRISITWPPSSRCAFFMRISHCFRQLCHRLLPLNPISKRMRERSDEEEAMTALSSFPILSHQ